MLGNHIGPNKAYIKQPSPSRFFVLVSWFYAVSTRPRYPKNPGRFIPFKTLKPVKPSQPQDTKPLTPTSGALEQCPRKLSGHIHCSSFGLRGPEVRLRQDVYGGPADLSEGSVVLYLRPQNPKSKSETVTPRVHVPT